jgi:hypothetical protein
MRLLRRRAKLAVARTGWDGIPTSFFFDTVSLTVTGCGP